MTIGVIEAPAGRPMTGLAERRGDELERLAIGLGVPTRPAREVFDMLAAAPLAGPFVVDGRRFSGLQRDGIPLEWSVSAGNTPGGLRFVVDHGVPGASMMQRTRRSLSIINRTLDCAGIPGPVTAAYSSVIRSLLPPSAILDRLVMGIWIAVRVDAHGRVGFTVYVNQQFGTFAERWWRLIGCLMKLGRDNALGHLDALAVRSAGALEPRGIAVEVGGDRIGRVKLYSRTRRADRAFLTTAATAVGCHDAGPRLDRFLAAMGAPIGFDPRAAIVSIEFPPNGGEPAFKVDVNTLRHCPSDAAAHRSSLAVLDALGLDDREYRALVSVCSPHRSRTAVGRFTWVGTALRGDEQRVNVYLNPGDK